MDGLHSDTLRFGVIGCGTIGQIKHIPNISELQGVKLHALCDASQHRVEVLSNRYGVKNTYVEPGELINEKGDELDGLVICTPSFTHPEVGARALESDIPVLMEKPLALTVEGADQLVAAAEDSGVPAMVGYMKRYSDAYQTFVDRVEEMDELDFISVLDVDPAHRQLNDEMYDLIGANFDKEQEHQFEKERLKRAKQAIGTDEDELANAYYFRLEHACHDLDILRSVFGEFDTIKYVEIFNDGTNLRTVFDIGGVNCAVTEGWSAKNQFEQWIRADSAHGTTRIDFTNSFIRNSFDEVTTQRDGKVTTYTGSHKDTFRAELEHFVKVITGDTSVRTPFASAREDVQLMCDIFKNYQNEKKAE